MGPLFWAQNFGFWSKNDDDPILALGMTVNFSPWERFFDFQFPNYSRFHKKKLGARGWEVWFGRFFFGRFGSVVLVR